MRRRFGRIPILIAFLIGLPIDSYGFVTISILPTSVTGGGQFNGFHYVTCFPSTPCESPVTRFLRSDKPDVVPHPSYINATADWKWISFRTNPVSVTTTVKITGIYPLTVLPAMLDEVELSSDHLFAGRTMSATVALNGRTPVEGATVELSSSDREKLDVPE